MNLLSFLLLFYFLLFIHLKLLDDLSSAKVFRNNFAFIWLLSKDIDTTILDDK